MGAERAPRSLASAAGYTCVRDSAGILPPALPVALCAELRSAGSQQAQKHMLMQRMRRLTGRGAGAGELHRSEPGIRSPPGLPLWTISDRAMLSTAMRSDAVASRQKADRRLQTGAEARSGTAGYAALHGRQQRDGDVPVRPGRAHAGGWWSESRLARDVSPRDQLAASGRFRLLATRRGARQRCGRSGRAGPACRLAPGKRQSCGLDTLRWLLVPNQQR